ncbi:MAG TPA: NAD(P)H-hydrate dehydratase, partial [Methylophilaceae bacterium]|nr:NAD(P)H-hydrate dehydratase [Methylophilaceae bacterium]
YTLEGPDHAGTVLVSDLGLDVQSIAASQGWLLQDEMFIPPLPPRRHNSHKGLYGNVTIVGGSEGMTGAALLAARAALLCGGGRIYVGLLSENAPLVDPLQPELMLRHAADLHDKVEASCAVIGPGLGRSPQAVKVLKAWLAKPLPLVLDADALQLVAQNAELKALLQRRTSPTVMTPHPGEASALAGCSGAEIQHDRITSALKLARDFNAITILKGAGSVIAEPAGNWYINTSGNPGLSSAGTGDVLAGMLGAFIAQGLEAGDAARLAVWLHGAAADELVSHGVGPVGLTASEVAAKVRTLINRTVAVKSSQH